LSKSKDKIGGQDHAPQGLRRRFGPPRVVSQC